MSDNLDTCVRLHCVTSTTTRHTDKGCSHLEWTPPQTMETEPKQHIQDRGMGRTSLHLELIDILHGTELAVTQLWEESSEWRMDCMSWLCSAATSDCSSAADVYTYIWNMHTSFKHLLILNISKCAMDLAWRVVRIPGKELCICSGTCTCASLCLYT